MVPASWSRPVRLSVAVLTALVLAACSGADAGKEAAPGGSTPGRTGLPGAATVEQGRVSLLQKVGQDGPLRRLEVSVDGRWECADCAGDGVTSAGSLASEQVTRLQALLADPGLAKETDEARQYRVSCIGALTSTLLTAAGLITSQDCPGEERPPIAYEILLLLTQATPAEPTA
ncbi:hypothetical protein [Micromonospora endolithica]|uniref:hypothetical protein n=1 Tax=Micromonospora endolithica TaxID=230091 RepID=UPI0011AD5D8E|nr:hypothetical protein [Micromonospora endolithica]TWJ25574.1 hypothetical protein JD76_05747 [Micromonospora endolithica]